MTTTTDTHTHYTAWAALYEEHLRVELLRLADRWAGNYQDALAHLVDRAGQQEWRGYEGPWSDALRWDGGSLSKAELQTTVALHLRKMLDGDDPERQDAIKAVRIVRQHLRTLVGDAMRSNGGTGELAARMLGAAAHAMLESDWDNLAQAAYQAWYETRKGLVGEADEAAQAINRKVQDLKGQQARARSDARKAELAGLIDGAEAAYASRKLEADTAYYRLGGKTIEDTWAMLTATR